MKKILVLASGGFDSSVLIHFMAQKGYEVYPVYVRQGLLWEQAELYWLKKYLRAYRNRFSRRRLRPLAILDMPAQDIYGSHWSLTGKKIPGYRSRDQRVYLPGRNILLLSKIAVFGSLAGIHEIALGTLAGNPFADATPKFFNAMEKVLRLGLKKPFHIHTPFSGLKKREVARLASGLPLQFTFSCLKPKGIKSCRRCNKCREFLEPNLKIFC